MLQKKIIRIINKQIIDTLKLPLILTCLFRDCCFPDSKSSPNSTVHHSYSHLARRYSSFALEIPDVAFWWPSPSSSSMSWFPKY